MPVDFETRFFSRIETGSGCWLWLGARDRDGYGQIKCAGRQCKAHRIMFAWVRGAIADDLQICHSCDNPPCVNPEHLFAGTGEINMQDCKQKGRLADRRGVKNTLAKLVDGQILEIRARRSAGEMLKSIAASFGVSESRVSLVARGLAWEHVQKCL